MGRSLRVGNKYTKYQLLNANYANVDANNYYPVEINARVQVHWVLISVVWLKIQSLHFRYICCMLLLLFPVCSLVNCYYGTTTYDKSHTMSPRARFVKPNYILNHELNILLWIEKESTWIVLIDTSLADTLWSLICSFVTWVINVTSNGLHSIVQSLCTEVFHFYLAQEHIFMHGYALNTH